MSRRMLVGTAQYTAVRGDITANLELIEGFVKEAARKQARMLALPELATTGYLKPECIGPLAESIPGPTFARLQRIARDYGIGLACGIAEFEPSCNSRFNSMVLLNRKGDEILRYRKVHLWETENQWAEPGDSFPVADFEQMPTGMWICYDSRFPETGRSLAHNGAKLALVATAWLGPGPEWILATRSRAMDNGIFVVGSALQGPHFHGPSLIVSPHGTILAQGEEGRDMVVYAEVDNTAVERFRGRLPLLQHRRPSAYTQPPPRNHST